MYSGVRYKELINLKLTDVDFTHKVITVSLGKGAKDRMIPLCESLEGYLFPYVQERAALNPYSIFFFVSQRTHGKMSDNVIKRLFVKLQKKSKLKFHPHMLRHTFATLMLEGGCDIFSLSKMMGHSDIKTTAIYLSATVKHLQGQMRKHPLQ
jgi:site-specific recombinase XerD